LRNVSYASRGCPRSAGRGIGQDETAADDPDAGIGEPPDHAPERLDVGECVRVRQEDDLAAHGAEGRIEHAGLSTAQRRLQQPHSRVRDTANGARGFIAAAVRRDHDLEAIGRIVERQRIRDAIGNDLLLVMCGNQDRYWRKVGVGRPVARRHTSEDVRESPQGDRIQHIRVSNQSDAYPEHDLDNDSHHRELLL
jgi:hypothetical protein